MIRRLFITFNLAVFTVGTEYFSRNLLLLIVASMVGFFLILRTKLVTPKIIERFAVLLLFFFGVVTSKLFFNDYVNQVINVLFVIRLLLFGFLLIVFFYHFKPSFNFYRITSLFYLPHLLGLVLGIVSTKLGQYNEPVFGGFHKDPNYLSPDLLFSLTSQLFVLAGRPKLKTKAFMWINFLLTLYLLLSTGSRTATMSFILILLLMYPLFFVTKNFLKTLSIAFGLFFFFLMVKDSLFQLDKVSYLNERFQNDSEGSSLLQNERYDVWLLAYETIMEGDFFEGYGVDKFLENKYRFVSHNVFLNAGMVYGKYTLVSHLLLFVASMILYTRKFLSGTYTYQFNHETYFFILCLSQMLMMCSISVSFKYTYWFVLLVLINFGFYTPLHLKGKKSNKLEL